MTKNKPNFEMIFGIFVVQPGYVGVKRHLGGIQEVVQPGYIYGIPFVDDIALVPETPGTISGLEQEVRSSDNRKITVTSETSIVVQDPIVFMRKAPDNYLGQMEPKINHAVQQTTGGQYTAEELVERNDELGGKVHQQLNEALRSLGWGLTCTLFRYVATTDPADLISGDAAKLRQAELADAKGKRAVAAEIAGTEGEVQYIVRKYQIDGNVYALREEGVALARVLEETGSAEAAVLDKKLEAYAKYGSKVVDTIASVRAKLQGQDAEVLIVYLLSPLEGMLKGEEATGGSQQVREAVLQRIRSRLHGEGQGAYLDGLSKAGVNPNLKMVADTVGEYLNSK